MARPYGKDSMMYNCYYVPALYKDLITNSYFYSNWGASQGTKHDPESNEYRRHCE